jgi:hypothetical protein
MARPIPRWCIQAAGSAICLAMLCLAGCSDRDYYKNPPREPEPLVAVADPPAPPVKLDDGSAVSVDAPVAPTTPDITMDPRRPQDKTDKADVYWKLVYLAGTNGARRPTELLKQEIAKTLDDPAKELIYQIVAVLERANDAYNARQRPGRPGSLTDDLPWGANRSEFGRALAPASDETGPPLTNARKKKKLEDFNAQYQLPPELVRASAVEEAKTLIAELRHMLNEERRRDHDFLIGPDEHASADGGNDLKLPGATTSSGSLELPPP